MEFLAINSLNGFAFGSVLFLLAVGFTLILGILGSLQLAHGAVYMIGAYAGWTIFREAELSWAIALIAGGLAGALVGLIIYQSCVRFLYKLINEQAVATFGFVYIITNLTLWIWGGAPKTPFTAGILSESFRFMGISYPTSRLVLIVIGVVAAVALWALVNNTRYGAMVRAGMDDKETAMALGINVTRVSGLVFVFGAFLAGLAGVLGAQILGATTDLAIDVLPLALAVTVVGGLGSVPGAMIGATIIGLADAFGRALLPQFAMYIFFFVIVVMLLVRPAGILGTGRGTLV